MSRLISCIAKHDECPSRCEMFLVIHRSWALALRTGALELYIFTVIKVIKCVNLNKTASGWLLRAQTSCSANQQHWHGWQMAGGRFSATTHQHSPCSTSPQHPTSRGRRGGGCLLSAALLPAEIRLPAPTLEKKTNWKQKIWATFIALLFWVNNLWAVFWLLSSCL